MKDNIENELEGHESNQDNYYGKHISRDEDISYLLSKTDDSVKYKEKGFKFDQEGYYFYKTVDDIAGTKENASEPLPANSVKRKRTKSILLYVSIFLIIFLSGVALGYKTYYMNHSNGNIVKTEWGDAIFDIPQSQEMVNILAMGFDKGGYRTDTMMVINYNPKTSNVNLISIPRDTLVGIKGKQMKLNAAFGMGKFDLTLNTIRKLTGLPIHYYIAVDTEGFRNIIDILGGVQFDVPKDMKYSDPTQNLNIDLKKGPQLLNGDKAEQLVRYRKYAMGDLERENVQKDFVKALIAQKINLANISDPSKMKAVYNNLSTHVKTNVGFNDIMKYFVSALNIKSENFKTFTLPGVPKMINGVSYYVYNKQETVDLFKQILGQDFELRTDLNQDIRIYDINEINQMAQSQPKTSSENQQKTDNKENDKEIMSIEDINIEDQKDIEDNDTEEVKPTNPKNNNLTNSNTQESIDTHTNNTSVGEDNKDTESTNSNNLEAIED